MHTLAMQLAPVLAAENSKVPFYVAGGVLVAWALFVSLALGLRRPSFPDGPSAERAVMAISAVLVLAAVATALITSGGSTAGAEKAVASTSTEPAPASNPPAQSGGTSQPPATTGATSARPAPAGSAGSGSPASLKLAANPTGLLSFDVKQLSAKAGAVAITLTNTSPVEHNVAVAQGSTVLGATPTFTGGNRKLTLNLKPGTYTFYCTVPGHRQAGMEGALKVS
jgi:plastocyanin